mmetsp:Transcript_21394/g.47411  ORF Transcript_21394/g.47411 Transcript_21394/m.47411 type:complete len:213 (+) Transcript_21394:932-1570(+)
MLLTARQLASASNGTSSFSDLTSLWSLETAHMTIATHCSPIAPPFSSSFTRDTNFSSTAELRTCPPVLRNLASLCKAVAAWISLNPLSSMCKDTKSRRPRDDLSLLSCIVRCDGTRTAAMGSDNIATFKEEPYRRMCLTCPATQGSVEAPRREAPRQWGARISHGRDPTAKEPEWVTATAAAPAAVATATAPQRRRRASTSRHAGGAIEAMP